MSANALSLRVRAAVIAVILCLLVLCGHVYPSWLNDTLNAGPGHRALAAWQVFLWLAALPCFAILVYIWKAAGAVRRDEVFTSKMARWIQVSATLLFADAGFLFIGNLVLYWLGLSHWKILLISMLADICAIAVAVLAAVLARYVTKAAALQEESEGTV
jgi:hypothetical protein